MADQHVNAYFKSEDDAQDAQTKLKVAGAREYKIEEIPEGEDGLTVPLFAFAGTGAGTTAGTGTGAGGIGGTSGSTTTGLPAFFAFSDDEDDRAERKIMSSFLIDEQQYKEALNLIKKAGGKVYY